MRIYLTAPYCDAGVQIIETLAPPVGNCFDYMEGGFLHQTRHWYRRGETWHTSKRAAVAAAAKFRLARISKALTEASRVSSLPPISAECEAK